MLEADFKILEVKSRHDTTCRVKRCINIKKKWDRVNAKKRENKLKGL